MAWKHFTRSEFDCKCGCGHNNIVEAFVDRLDAVRELAGVPFVITSGCRCAAHNAAVSSCRNPESSPHLKGVAADILVGDSRSRHLVLRAVYDDEAGFKRVGIGRKSFIHVDADSDKTSLVTWTY